VIQGKGWVGKIIFLPIIITAYADSVDQLELPVSAKAVNGSSFLIISQQLIIALSYTI